MKRLLVLLTLLALPSLAAAQSSIGGVRPLRSGAVTLNTTSSGTCTATSCVSLAVGGYSAVSVQVTGTCGTCTLQFEASVDGTNWVALNMTPLNSSTAVTSTTSDGVWQAPAAVAQVRARLSARSSGSFVVSLQATLSVQPNVVTDSGSAVPGGSDTQMQFNDGGSFGGDASAVYDKTTHTLTLANLVIGTTAIAVLGGSTPSIGGGALLAGACASDTATVTGATTAMTATASPVTYPGDGNYWLAYVSASDTVTVVVCAAVAGTPTASVYRVRVIK